MSDVLPPRIETERLVLRPWAADDAPKLKEAVDSSLPELRRWMHWARDEPTEVAALRDRIDRFAVAFAAEEDWHYGILSRDEAVALGATGFHRRVGPGGLEIGYWIRSSATGQGLASEATLAMTGAAFGLSWVEFVELRCDPNNVRSARVAQRTGYELIEILRGDTLTPAGDPRDTMVWRITREEFGRRIDTGALGGALGLACADPEHRSPRADAAAFPPCRRPCRPGSRTVARCGARREPGRHAAPPGARLALGCPRARP